MRTGNEHSPLRVLSSHWISLSSEEPLLLGEITVASLLMLSSPLSSRFLAPVFFLFFPSQCPDRGNIITYVAMRMNLCIMHL